MMMHLRKCCEHECSRERLGEGETFDSPSGQVLRADECGSWEAVDDFVRGSQFQDGVLGSTGDSV